MSEHQVGTPLSLHDPRTVGPWAIHSRLGAGGMGVVFYATCEGREAAAIKVIRPGLLDTPATRDRFRREVGILRSVRDVHICQFLDADLESEPAWLALEYLSGPVLRDRVAADGALPEAEWWELARGLAQALAVLELHRITHRDLKPGNVILNERGPVLIDFGIAHPEDATSLTATGLVTGSPAWLSPEQANLEPTGPATDIFTLGSLLAYAATGRPPFGEGASVAVLMSIIKRDPDLEGIDPVRAALLRRMLAKDPAARPGAREVLEIARAGGTEPLAADTLVGDPAATRVDAPTIAVPPLVTPAAAPPVAPAPAPARDQVTSTQPDLPRVTAAPAFVPASSATAAPGPPPPRTTGARSPGPRTAAAQARRARRRRWVVGLVVVGLVALLGWLALGALGVGGDSGSGSAGSSSSGQPGSAADAPPAPAADQLVSGDWLLESYRLDNTADGLVVSGTVRNRGASPASADLRVWVYRGQESLGSVATTVSDVPGKAAVPVTMTGDAVWKSGAKTVLLEASPR
jgi:hypothetical protein